MMRLRGLSAVILALLLWGCGEKDSTVVPAFVHIDAIQLVTPTENAVTTDAGFYTSDIVAVRLVAHRANQTSLDTLGLYELPITAPVLCDGTLDYLEVTPTVQQSGSSKALIPYTFYKSIKLSNVSLHSGDTLNLGTLTTTYDPIIGVLMYELFEPVYGSLKFDSVMIWEAHAPTEACTGEGYGRVHVLPTESSKDFSITNGFVVNDATLALYLELDTRSDMDFEVYMNSSYRQGGSIVREPVMVVRASDEWKHLYINLGRTWINPFNNNPNFSLSFAALNVNGVEGDIRLDNIKLITRP